MRERPDVDLNLIQRQLTAITRYLKENVWKPQKNTGQANVTPTEVPDRTPSANHSLDSNLPNESPTSQNQ
jgi:hypothetical protein